MRALGLEFFRGWIVVFHPVKILRILLHINFTGDAAAALHGKTVPLLFMVYKHPATLTV